MPPLCASLIREMAVGIISMQNYRGIKRKPKRTEGEKGTQRSWKPIFLTFKDRQLYQK